VHLVQYNVQVQDLWRLGEISLLFDLSLNLDRTLAQRKAQRKAKSNVKVTQCRRQVHCDYTFVHQKLSKRNLVGLQ